MIYDSVLAAEESRGGAAATVVWTTTGFPVDNDDPFDTASRPTEMVLDEKVVPLQVSDVLVQRGTIHNWVNSGSEPCVIAFVLIGARPATIDGSSLPAIG